MFESELSKNPSKSGNKIEEVLSCPEGHERDSEKRKSFGESPAAVHSRGDWPAVFYITSNLGLCLSATFFRLYCSRDHRRKVCCPAVWVRQL